MFGATKFSDPAKWIDHCVAWGLRRWLVSVSGVLEIAGTISVASLVIGWLRLAETMAYYQRWYMAPG